MILHCVSKKHHPTVMIISSNLKPIFTITMLSYKVLYKQQSTVIIVKIG